MIAQNETVALVFNSQKITDIIVNFLQPKDTLSLILTNSIFYNTVLQSIQNFQILKLNYFLKQETTKKTTKVKQLPCNRKSVKINFYDIPQQIILSNFWKKVEKVEKQKIITELQLNQKFIYDFDIFQSFQQHYFIINRSLSDPQLQLQNYLQSEEEDKYKLYFESQEVDQYDYSDMKSMMKKQLTIQKKMTQKLDLNQLRLKIFKQITVIVCQGGNFSVGFFQGNKDLKHKSDHKYVCRKKGSGQRQVQKDKKKTIKSMGSQIRRENEKLHKENVESIFEECLDVLEHSDLILVQAPGINKNMVVEDKNLMKFKQKIRGLCIHAKKANYTEVQKLFDKVCSCYFII